MGKPSSLLRNPHWSLLILLLAVGPGLAADTTAHPLDPLSKQEIAAATQVLKSAGKITEQSRTPVFVLHEPAKEDVLSFRPGSKLQREAFVIVYERASNQTFEAVVDLTNNRLASWKEVPGVQPPLMLEDFQLVEQIVKADPRWQAAMLKRGLTDPNEVSVNAWPVGEHNVPGLLGARLLCATGFYKGRARNYYARPIEGVVAYVNLNTLKVFKFVDTGVVPIPKAAADFDPGSVGKLRTPPKPLLITQPDDVSFTVVGNEVRWQKWRFRFAMHQREGLVLYTVGYEDRGKTRPILYRGSLAELFVPYGEPSTGWFFRNIFDMGMTGVGWLSGSLEARTDCPDNARLFDAVFANDVGTAYDVPRCVALYERDGGVLWKHYDYTDNESRRARQLVLSSISTLGNYEYGINWIFHQDGCLEVETILTGIMSARAVPTGAMGHGRPRHGHLVAPGVECVHHQHFFNFRLDLDVDGPSNNSVVELNTKALSRTDFPSGRHAFSSEETTFRTEQDGKRQLNLATDRRWKVINTTVQSAPGQPTGYLLVPGENTVSHLPTDSPSGRRAGFINSHLWVTPYDPGQMYPAGYYVDQLKPEDGLPVWTNANRPIANKDIVLWYTMGVTHIPRPEEWPVMPVHRLGFKLVPSGFFTRNPALDVPRP
jgi:primary-amine oxidase